MGKSEENPESYENHDSHGIGSSTFYGLLIVALIVTVFVVIYIADRALHPRPVPRLIAHQLVRLRTTGGLGRRAVENIPTVEFHEQPASKRKATIHMLQHSPVLRTKPATPKRSMLSMFQRYPGGVSPPSLESGILKTEEVSSLCSICTEDFIEGVKLRKLPCGHLFHPQCIDPWLMDRARTCPLCRVDLALLSGMAIPREPPTVRLAPTHSTRATG
ncbi:hypothetical protein CDV31_002598 [Fusarium ambrosium]|uniref:RING-type domain-containing protein n=1 Tax=Fusarium ambrosium TaxID=131363 RepID=A0A428UVZ2_9HYPO|nr:hypothetical protein CDV31_002598 [Fusarium ambrosium]